MLRGTGAHLAEGAIKGTAYVRIKVFPARVNSPKHVLLLSTVRSLGLFFTILEGRISLVASYAKGQRQRHVLRLARVLALHVFCTCLRLPCPRLHVC